MTAFHAPVDDILFSLIHVARADRLPGWDSDLGRRILGGASLESLAAHAIDEEIRAVIDRNYQRSRDILTDNIDKLHTMAEALIKYETIDAEQMDDIMSGRTPRPPVDWDESGQRPGGGARSRAKADEDKGSEGTLGTPAGQH